MSSVGSKTPVSVLNEYFIKRGVIPKFELVINGTGMQNPIFEYELECEANCVYGRGRSKQEAKHQAAIKMLELLNIPFGGEAVTDVKQLVVPYEGSVGYNAVGLLSEMCTQKCYPEPMYSEVSQVGPPHAKIFTIKCCVSKVSTIAKARTKKEAKQSASHKMLTLLRSEAGEEHMAVALPKNKSTNSDESILIIPKSNAVYQPKVYLYKDYCNAHLFLNEKSETLANVLTKACPVTLENSCKLVLDISTELGVTVMLGKLDKGEYIELSLDLLENNETLNDAVDECATNGSDNKESKDVIFLTMELLPAVLGKGYKIPESAQNLLENLIELCT